MGPVLRAAALALAGLWVAAAGAGTRAPTRPKWRGVYFNPQVNADPNYPWLLTYPDHRERVRRELRELVTAAGVNLVDVFVMIPNSLKEPARGNRTGEPLTAWANLAFLDRVAAFVDDCHEAGIQAELDLVDNRWIPYSVDSANHIGKPGGPWWPVAGDTPWKESAEWYRAMIEGIEARTKHPEAIAIWCMMGNYTWGSAEPVLWDDDGRPEVRRSTERFIRGVWPAFRAAGRRPKAAPILLPIFAAGGYWATRTPMERLAGFANLKRWIVDDLKLPPDYWVMSAYPCCAPASDGFDYLKAILKILGPGSAARMVSTDLKAAGHDDERRDTIIRTGALSGAELLAWHLRQCARLRFAGWWVWAYQDTPTSRSGLRTLSGDWKPELLAAIRRGGR